MASPRLRSTSPIELGVLPCFSGCAGRPLPPRWQRARALARQAVAAGEPWTRRLGPMPNDDRDRECWLEAASTVAAYRDRYGITSNLPAGGGSANEAQHVDRRRALRAVRTATAAAEPLQNRHEFAAEGRSISAPQTHCAPARPQRRGWR